MSRSSLSAIEFESNPEPRCAVVLLLDTSSSMSGAPIAELNAGMRALEEEMRGDALAQLRSEVAVVAFGGTPRVIDTRTGGNGGGRFDADSAFVSLVDFRAPTLVAGGLTPMGDAVRRGIDLLRQRKSLYKANNIDYFRPWMFLITDGAPTDNGWETAAASARDEERRKGFTMFPIGVEGADMQVLQQFSGENSPLKLNGLEFKTLFIWLSKSLSAVSGSKPGDQIGLPPVGWGTVQT